MLVKLCPEEGGNGALVVGDIGAGVLAVEVGTEVTGVSVGIDVVVVLAVLGTPVVGGCVSGA